MRSFILRPFHAFAAALVLTLVALAAAPAHAQSGAAVIVNTETILTQSLAGRDMAQRLQAIQTQMQGELQPDQTWLQQEGQALAQARQGQTDEQVRANSQLVRRFEEFERRRQAFAQRLATLERDMQYTQLMARQEFNRQLTPIVREVMQARNAQIVVDRSTVLLANEGVDATQDVLRLMDERVRTINVTRQTAPAPQQPQQ
ncbi:MAG: OmpH family outer membrane protein [Hydrogenophilaceae bacterium]|jgi:outer membrane protein|nr:OmpH family outer membrane protein [Hydrogenophilaceae bacterium]